MKKLFISADIEGTCGIAHWDETRRDKPDYAPFARQMTLEVLSACEGATLAGATDILVKDAHESARNIDPAMMPENVRLLRGWTGNPLCMMAGLTPDTDAVFMTGYHAWAGSGGNPLAHTMDTQVVGVWLNEEPASELLINSLIAGHMQVPVALVTGDSALCQWMRDFSPHTLTVPVNEGLGGGVTAVSQQKALGLIRDAAKEAMATVGPQMLVHLPKRFQMRVMYDSHYRCYRNSFYPGAQTHDERSLVFESDDFEALLKFMHFCL